MDIPKLKSIITKMKTDWPIFFIAEEKMIKLKDGLIYLI